MQKKKKALIISYGFPIRIIKFAKYLPEFGWEPTIITADIPGDMPKISDTEITTGKIIRTQYFDLQEFITGKLINKKNTISRAMTGTGRKANNNNKILNAIRLLSPIYSLPLVRTLLLDPQGWYPYAVKKGLEIVANDNIDLIFSTYSPSTCHLIASRIHEKTGVPWVAEFRDLWSFNPNVRKIQPFHFLEKQLEKRVMSGCSQLITVSEPLAERLESLHHKKVTTIFNGFDEADFIDEVPLTHKFTITYTGGIYGKRDPTALFESLDLLKKDRNISLDNFEARFYGSGCPLLNKLIARYNLSDLVKIYPAVPYQESVRKQKESTVLLFVGWDDPAETGNFSTKVFEYFGAKRPILSLSQEWELVSELVTKSGCGIVANKPEKIKDILLQWIKEFREYGDIISYHASNAEIRKNYARREQTRKLADLFDNIISTPSTNK